MVKKINKRTIGKRTIRKCKKIVALLVATAVLGTGLNLQSMCESIYAKNRTEKAEVNKFVSRKATEVKELKKLRTESTSTYLMNDGTKKLKIYTDIVNSDNDVALKKMNKKEKKILKSIVGAGNAEEYVAVNNDGDGKQFFPEILAEDNTIVMSKDGCVLEFAPKGISEDEGYVATKSGAEITYCSEKSHIQYQYISLKEGVKENIILESKPVSNIFEFEINLSGIEVEIQEYDGSLLITNEITGETVGYIAPPHVSDAKGNISYEDVKYVLEDTLEGKILKLVVDEKYFENPNIKYPVIVDPTICWDQADEMENIVMTYTDGSTSENSVENFNSSTSITITKDTKNGYVKFPNLDEELKGKIIYSATLSLYAVYSGTNTALSFYPILSSWNENEITAYNAPQVEDKVVASYNNDWITGRNYVDLTSWLRGVSSGEYSAEYGLQIKNLTSQTIVSKSISTILPTLEIEYYDPDEQIYDNSIMLTSECNLEADNITLTWEDENKGNYSSVNYYLYKIEDGIIEYVTQTDNTFFDIAASDIKDKVDYRIVGNYTDDSENIYNYVSNIITIEKVTVESVDEDGNEVTEESYEMVTVDTDGDGLEDGYEIWDFNTKYNEIDEDGSYVLDSDEDGFDDGYEVFVLETNPAAANLKENDSDGDGWTDLVEYQMGTDPYLTDSDFDNTKDSGDSNPRKTSGYTRAIVAAKAKVYNGIYTVTDISTEDGVTSTSIYNIYSGNIKSEYKDYGSKEANVLVKFFYDGKGNTTAMIQSCGEVCDDNCSEDCDEHYDKDGSKTVCSTYMYNENNQVEFVCDQRTKYTMEYDEGKMTSFEIGSNKIVEYSQEILIENTEEIQESEVAIGEVIEETQETTSYANGNKVKTVDTSYKVELDDFAAVAKKSTIYYNDEATPSYVFEYNQIGSLIRTSDYTQDSTNPLVYTYTYTDDVTTVERNDGFVKKETIVEDEENNKSTTTTEITFTNVNNTEETYKTTTEVDFNNNEKTITNITYPAGLDKLTITENTNNEDFLYSVWSANFNKTIITSAYTKNSNVSASLQLDLINETNLYDYTYDLRGNITKISLNEKTLYEYTYDPYGRLIAECDYRAQKAYEYVYNETGNMQAKIVDEIDEQGNVTNNNIETIYAEYENDLWPDQLTSFNDVPITYDTIGNPVKYYNGMEFMWERERELTNIVLADGGTVKYKYNSEGLRIYKETEEAITEYEWDDTTLIREYITYKENDKEYDIWYRYDASGEIIGYEVSTVYNISVYPYIVKSVQRLYYEKDLEGNVIGIIDINGDRVASYTYDAWGNVVSESIDSTNFSLQLNSIRYRGYYMDRETGFYYLQSRYYDSITGRFLSADDTSLVNNELYSLFATNLYCYCNSNPVGDSDPTGRFSLSGVKQLFKWLINEICKVKNFAIFIDLLMKVVPAFGGLFNAIKTYQTVQAKRQLNREFINRSRKVILEYIKDDLDKQMKKYATATVVNAFTGLATELVDAVLTVVGTSLGTIIANGIDRIDKYKKNGYVFIKGK